MSAAGRGRPGAVALIALLAGVAFVALYDASLAHSRYPYSGDSASYIEMAATLKADGRPRVTPWEIDPGGVDAVPQRLFPPGFAVVVAALIPLAGDARTAATWPSRAAAALLPLLVLVWWRGLAAPALLALAGGWALVSPGVREWQYIAYSDVSALALAVAALGLLARSLDEAGDGRPAWRWLLAGALAGLCYAVRNAGLAVLAAAAAAQGYAWLRGWLRPRAVALWSAGALVPVAALEAYNLATFGSAWPYTMPPSVRGWLDNAGDLATAQLTDLGLPAALVGAVPVPLLLAVLAAVFGALAAAFLATRRERASHLRLGLLLGYAGAGALLLVASRSRFEWGNLIDSRNVLQYSFAFGLALVVALGALAPRRGAAVAAAVLGLLVIAQASAAVREALAARSAPAETWLELTRDQALMARVGAIGADTLVASNAAVLFRIGALRAARQLDVGGGDGDFAGSLALLAAAAGKRPSTFILVCNEWTWRFAACGAAPGPPSPACVAVRLAAPRVAECAPARPARGPGADVAAPEPD